MRVMNDFDWSKGAADVRSTIRIVESQKEKCDELRQQFHVLQERLQYLTQLKETLLTRLNQLIEMQALSINNSAKPTPRFADDPFRDESLIKSTSINGEYRNHDVEEADQQQQQQPQQQMDYNEVLGSLASVITKICSQVNYQIRSATFGLSTHMNEVTHSLIWRFTITISVFLYFFILFTLIL